jgi:uncharacterized LabA/DUF88 family protein
MLPVFRARFVQARIGGVIYYPAVADRVVLFIDAQNTYRCARDWFTALPGGPGHTHGQVDPLKIGQLICSRPPPNTLRVLSEVRVYTGRPESTKQSRAYAAHMRQCAAWEKSGVTVIARSLRYPGNWPQEKPREKGIDVALAVDFVAGAVDGRYDVGVIFSTDTDLRPALEFVAKRFSGSPRAESAAWRAPGANKGLVVRTPKPSWCHYLDAAAYAALHDPTDYNT